MSREDIEAELEDILDYMRNAYRADGMLKRSYSEAKHARLLERGTELEAMLRDMT